MNSPLCAGKISLLRFSLGYYLHHSSLAIFIYITDSHSPSLNLLDLNGKFAIVGAI